MKQNLAAILRHVQARLVIVVVRAAIHVAIASSPSDQGLYYFMKGMTFEIRSPFVYHQIDLRYARLLPALAGGFIILWLLVGLSHGAPSRSVHGPNALTFQPIFNIFRAVKNQFAFAAIFRPMSLRPEISQEPGF